MDAKRLNAADFETGMVFERRLAAAQWALVEANAGYQSFVSILRERYAAPEDAWILTDWAVGFTRGVPAVEIEGKNDVPGGTVTDG